MGLNMQGRYAGGFASPQPEDVFLSWLLAQPGGADLAEAAEIEIRKLQRYQGNHPGPQKLLELFEGLRGSAAPGSTIPPPQ
ncbi:hypothetical protein [Mesorhizobium sp. 1M-11]|uniref:hypothetical protein n=1 Tax=Mesorhizobium sp. 1M-11 TaxID=1529006 RepID=UPI000A6E8E96|nr:hypothetical protein [Mesorhizobium sp. 1M-11]